MKKKALTIIVPFILFFSLVGCDTNVENEVNLGQDETEDVVENESPNEIEDEPSEIVDGVNQSLNAWIPRLENVKYSYEGSGNEYASYTWFPQFNQETYYQFAKDNDGTKIVDIYEYTDDEIIHTFSRPETYFRDNFTPIGTVESNKVYEIILKKPIALDTQWETNEASYQITSIDKEIDVPAGTYQTIEVTIKNQGMTTRRYYAENVGLVYEWTEIDDIEIESQLNNIQTDVAEKIPLTVYQMDDEIIGLDAIDAELSLNTNHPARLALQELLTGKVKDFEHIDLLPEGTKINYLFLNNKGIVEVDLSKEYIQNMNTGSAGESFYLIGLGNTFSEYYGTDKVSLTIDGKNYEGGHIILSDNDYLTFDEEMVNK